ncbi:hypothetical protein NMG60_11005852 [Bertholletia excelsa]
MADRHAGPGQTQRPARPTILGPAFLSRFHEHSPNPTQLSGFLALMITGGVLFLLTGITVTATVLGLIFFTPLIFVSSPVWVPVGAVLFFSVASFLCLCGFGVTATAVMSWMYRYLRGFHPPGSDRVDYARSRLADTASHVKDYAREYGGYWHRKAKDAAPGA